MIPEANQSNDNLSSIKEDKGKCQCWRAKERWEKYERMISDVVIHDSLFLPSKCLLFWYEDFFGEFCVGIKNN